MKKTIIIPLVFLCLCNAAYSQRVLEYTEKTEELSVFIDKDPEIINSGGAQAGVTISCFSNMSLTFESNVDKTVDVYKQEQKGGVNYYYLRFIVGRYKGTSYEGRVIQAIASDYVPLKIKLDLQPSESKWYEVFDRNMDVKTGCFFQHFNDASELFQKAMYTEALEKYKLSMACTDYQEKMNVKQKIETINNIISLRDKGDYFFNVFNFKEALEAYQKIIGYNSEDQYAINRSKEAMTRYSDNCTSYYQTAENYYLEGKYEEAKKLYEIIVAQKCNYLQESNMRLAEMDKTKTKTKKTRTKTEKSGQTQGERVALYEITTNTPIGLSYGNYKQESLSYYASLRLNPALFQAMGKNYDAKKPEFNVSLGLTKMVYEPVWAFVGLGYTSVGAWAKTNEDTNLKMHSAISPEVGVLVKLGPVALRYTFQYRYAFESHYKNYVGNMRHVGGIGYCF